MNACKEPSHFFVLADIAIYRLYNYMNLYFYIYLPLFLFVYLSL